MSYWTTRDFIEPIQKGNDRLPEAKKCFLAIENTNRNPLFIPCNLPGFMAVARMVPTQLVSSRQYDEGIHQLKQLTLERGEEYLQVLDILPGEFRILTSKLAEKPVEKLSSWYADIKNLNRILMHHQMRASGGAVNGTWELYKENVFGEEVLLSGYYNFRQNHLDDSDVTKLREFFENQEYSKEALFLGLF